MPRRTAGDETFEHLSEVLGDCDNHPGTPATAVTDGGGKHSLIKYCKACWARYEATRPVTRA